MNAYGAFDADWGVSLDNGLPGHIQIAQWLVDNGYYTDPNDARVFAETGYIGRDSGDPDPYFWAPADEVEFEIVGEIAGFADCNVLGYYTGTGDSKSFAQIFGGTEDGPLTLAINAPFGLYLGTPQSHTWFTDRGEHESQQDGALKRFGGNTQSLIYSLSDNEWLVAWEDLDASDACADRDYNDMWVKMSVVPEPVGTALFLLGAGAMTASRFLRRARRKETKRC